MPTLACAGIAVVVLCSALAQAQGQGSSNSTIVVQWNEAALQAIRDTRPGPPMAARALAIVNTCMYDAWAAYDNTALGTQLAGRLRRAAPERTEANKSAAVSFAAYRALIDLFPADETRIFAPLMRRLGYSALHSTASIKVPADVGNTACAAVLRYRHNDGSNQLADLTPGKPPYSDWTHCVSLNAPSTVPVRKLYVTNPDHWQPLIYSDINGVTSAQTFVGAQWFKVIPFALEAPDQFRPFIAQFGPAKYGSREYLNQSKELIEMSAELNDRQKMIAEYWADGPNSELPPGHWDLFGQFVSKRDRHTLDDDVKMFFALTNALFDASIVAWDAKRVFDSVRPATAIPVLFSGTNIRSWGGPGKGTVQMDGSRWLPYQPATFPTPPFPEYVSGHSAFSAAGAQILRLWTGNDMFGDSATFLPGSSKTEPGITPKSQVTIGWASFSDAADQAGISRRYGGIHFRAGDLVGRAVGRMVANQAWEKAQELWQGQAEHSAVTDQAKTAVSRTMVASMASPK